MKSLYEKLNRIDDSLVESKRVVKKKKLTESVEDDKKKLFDAAASVKCKLDDDTIEYAMYDVDDFIENELVYCGKLLLSERPDMLFWRYVSDENFGSYCAVYESDEEFADAFYQISHDRVYDITDEVNGDYDYDDDIDEMLTEGISKRSLIRWLKDHADQDISTDDFDTLVNNLWSVIEKENEERKFYKIGYKSIEEVDVPQLIDSSDNPVHDIGYRLLGWSDYDDDIDEILIEAELTDREKLMKTFPDLNIRSSKDFLKEAVKDTDYVIVYVHPRSTLSKRYTFLGSDYRMTKSLDKAMTYPGKFSAEDEIKYAQDAVEKVVDGLTSTGYASNFATDSDNFLVVTVAQAREMLKNPDRKVIKSENYLKEDSSDEHTEEELKQFARYYLKNCPPTLKVKEHNKELKDAAENEFGELTEAALKLLQSEVFNNLYIIVLTPDVERENHYLFLINTQYTKSLDNATAHDDEILAEDKLDHERRRLSSGLHYEGRDYDINDYMKRLTVMTVLQAEKLLHKHSAKKKAPKSAEKKQDTQKTKLLPGVKSFIENNVLLFANVEFYDEDGGRYSSLYRPKKSPEKYLNDWKQLIHLMKQELSQAEAKQAAEVLLTLDDDIPELIKKELESFK